LIDLVIQTLLIKFLGIIMMKLLSRLFVGMLLLTAISAHADTDYSDMVVFGDSLSDPGNVFVLTRNVTVSPYPEGNIPSWPYPIGQGKTYSNGATWSQLVAAELKLKRATGPALRNQRFTNYAFGGARASSSSAGPFDMSAQVTQFLADNGGVADSDALYAVWLGGNDVRDALVAFLVAYQTALAGGMTDAEAQAAGAAAAGVVITNAITNYATNMVTLIFAGASDFLVLNAPNVGLTPAVTAEGPLASGLATLLSFEFNTALSGVLDYLEGTFGSSIIRADMFALLTDVAASPGNFGLDNATDACLTPLVDAGAICESPKDYLFWDGIHPTRAGHEVVADAVLDALD
jgi:phospholipase/lecithinase/hemolysin